MGDKYGNGRILESIRQPQPQMAIAAPINDIQLLALMASRRPELTPKEAVDWAEQVLIEAVKHGKTLQASLRDAMLNG